MGPPICPHCPQIFPKKFDFLNMFLGKLTKPSRSFSPTLSMTVMNIKKSRPISRILSNASSRYATKLKKP